MLRRRRRVGATECVERVHYIRSTAIIKCNSSSRGTNNDEKSVQSNENVSF